MVRYTNHDDVCSWYDSTASWHDCICHCRDRPGYPDDYRLPRSATILFGRHITGGAAGGFPSNRPVFTEYDEVVLTVRDITGLTIVRLKFHKQYLTDRFNCKQFNLKRNRFEISFNERYPSRGN